MSPTTAQAAPALGDYLELFDALAELGVEFVVIGGCAVGAYARLLGETIVSADLDLLVSQRALEATLADSAALGVEVQERPSPRSIPVAVMSWRGREINLLTGASGFPPPDVGAARPARRGFPLPRSPYSSGAPALRARDARAGRNSVGSDADRGDPADLGR